MTLDASATAELGAIDAARECAYAALREANRRGLRGSDLDAMLKAMADVDAREAALHRRVWPRHRGRLVVALGMACLVSSTGRSTRVVWSRATTACR